MGRGKTVDLGDGYHLREILAPPMMLDRSLAELGIRERTGVQVLLVRSKAAGERRRHTLRVPTAADRFAEGDTLLVAGTEDGLAELERLGIGSAR